VPWRATTTTDWVGDRMPEFTYTAIVDLIENVKHRMWQRRMKMVFTELGTVAVALVRNRTGHSRDLNMPVEGVKKG
jgi:hypothetical protein